MELPTVIDTFSMYISSPKYASDSSCHTSSHGVLISERRYFLLLFPRSLLSRISLCRFQAWAKIRSHDAPSCAVKRHPNSTPDLSNAPPFFSAFRMRGCTIARPSTTFAIIFMNRHPTSVQTNPTNCCSNQNQEEIDEGQKGLGRRAEPFAIVDKQPENSGDPVCEPRCEQTGHDTK
jgi:hypothetical protein